MKIIRLLSLLLVFGTAAQTSMAQALSLKPVEGLQKLKFEAAAGSRFLLSCGNQLLTIDSQGKCRFFKAESGKIEAGNPLIADFPDFANTKAVINIPGLLLGIANNGTVTSVNDQTGAVKALKGAPVASSGQPSKYIFPLFSSIGVINTLGELWVHDVSKSVSKAYTLVGPKVGTTGIPSTHMFAWKDRLVVLNEKGELWAHRLMLYNKVPVITGAGKISGEMLKGIKFIFVQNDRLVVVSDDLLLSVYDIATA